MSHHFRGLESNPEVMGEFIHEGGCSNVSFHEVFSLEIEDLGFIPRPAYSLILLYPSKDLTEGNEEEYSSKLDDSNPNVYFMKQHDVGNACGIIATIHAVANNEKVIRFDEKSSLRELIQKTKNLDPFEKCKHMAEDASIVSSAENSASAGQTEAEEAPQDLDYHFICFSNVDNTIYELDGIKEGPLNHGPTTSDSFLEDAIKVIKKNYVEKFPGTIQFNVMALAPSVSD